VQGADAAVGDGGVSPDDGEGGVDAHPVVPFGTAPAEVCWFRGSGDDVRDEGRQTEREERYLLREGDVSRLVSQGRDFVGVWYHYVV